jgi:hypothetical protein
LARPPSTRYPGQGPSSLTDGRLGSRDFQDGHWLGYEEDDLEAVVELGEARVIRRVGLDCLRAQVSWIFWPRSVEFAVSADGLAWETVAQVELTLEADPETATQLVAAEVQTGPVRYVRVRARNLGRCPDWHAGAGGKAWLFADEIVLE